MKNWTIKKRVIFGFASVLFLATVVGLTAIVSLHRITLAATTPGVSGAVDGAAIEKIALSAEIWLTALTTAALAAGIGFGIAIIAGLGRALKLMAASLSQGSDEIVAASGQVSASSLALAEGANQQAASLQETSASLEEISSMTKKNADSAQAAKELAKKAHAAADAGTSDMLLMTLAMKEIKSANDEIGKIIKTIDEIAFQTNILALNAAVEAARAGEAGMGFAVVADEVRNLAHRSAQAAKETATLIEAAIHKTSKGVEMTREVSAGLEDIVNHVSQVDKLVAQIATASTEQSEGISQVNSSVAQLDSVVQSNAAAAQESASAAQELNAQAWSLQGISGNLQTLTGMTRLQAAPAAPFPVARSVKNESPHVYNGRSRLQRTPALAGSGPRKTSDLPLEGDFKDF